MIIIWLLSLLAFLLTVTESWWVFLVWRSIIAISALFTKKHRRSLIVTCLLSLLIVWRVFFMLESHHIANHDEADNLTMEIFTIQTIQQEKYIISDEEKKERIVRFTPWYFPVYTEWEEIFVTWYKQLARPDAQLTLTWMQSEIFFSWLSWFVYEFNYPKRQMMKWYHWVIYAQNSTSVGENPTWLQTIRNTLREKARITIQNNEYAGLFLWMLLWDISLMSTQSTDMFREANLIHIVAVSGWNIVLVVTFVSFLFFWLPVYVRYVVLIPVIIIYGVLAWLDSSVVRAVIMGILSLLALLSGRDVDIWRLMWLWWIMMLIRNPFYFPYDIWFLFSFGAIVWLIWMWHRRNRFVQKHKRYPEKSDLRYKKYPWLVIKNSLSLYLLPTIWASLWVLPFLLFFIGEFNLLWFISNIFVLPLVWVLTIWGLLVTISWWGAELYSYLMDYVFLVAKITQSYGIYLTINQQRIQWIILLCAGLLRVIRVIQHQKFDKEELNE